MLGTYRANFGSATADEIVLRADSVYIHRYMGSSGEQYVDSGGYEFVDYGRQSFRIHIREFVMVLPVAERCIEDRYPGAAVVDTVDWVVRVWKSRGRQMLEYCPNEVKYYVKVR